MRTIRVGRDGSRNVAVGVPDAPAVQPPSETMSDEQRKNLVESINTMPLEKRVSAFRSVGLDEEADAFEKSLQSSGDAPADGADVALQQENADAPAFEKPVEEEPAPAPRRSGRRKRQ